MDSARLHETHISWITLIGDRAYKLLKPVDTGFLDHREREARRAACRREVEVNRRFSPDVYLGVLDVCESDGSPRDHLIEMRRLPAAQRLSALLDDARAGDRVEEVADAIASIHRDSPRSDAIERAGTRGHLRRLWEDGWAQLRAAGSGAIECESIERAEALVRRYLAGRGPLIESRLAEGWVRDGHGDLLADDIYCTPDGPRILDCLAFDDRLRHGDVLMDVAFLAMDLEFLGHPGLAARLLGRWAEALDEDHPPSLAHHHIAYRAHVRAKVAAIRHAQGDAGAGERARALHELCLAHLERGRVRMVLIGGAPGTGKSTVAAHLGEATGWPVLRSDALREEALTEGDDDGARGYGQGRYGSTQKERVYDLLMSRAAAQISNGRSVILDASWSDARRRDAAAHTAESDAADVIEIECVAPAEVADARIAARGAGDISDATPAVASRMRAEFAAWPSAVTVPTDLPLAQSVQRAIGAVGVA